MRLHGTREPGRLKRLLWPVSVTHDHPPGGRFFRLLDLFRRVEKVSSNCAWCPGAGSGAGATSLLGGVGGEGGAAGKRTARVEWEGGIN